MFGNHGALWGNAMTWFDHDTGSIWSQPTGEAIAGPRRGETLELIGSTLTNWGDWQQRHPDTLALNVSDSGSTLELDRFAVVVELGSDSMAFPIADLRRRGAVNEVVNGVPVVVVADETGADWAVFSRLLDDEVIELEFEKGELREIGGTRIFDASLGTAVDGTQALDPLPGFTSFPLDYETFWPDGRFWTLDGVVAVGG